MSKKFLCIFIFVSAAHLSVAGTNVNNPILFVTQFPIAEDFTTIGSTFGNHSGEISVTGRGGDLYIRYTDGTLRNLTREAGFGGTGFQSTGSIAVRDPAVHWSATRALFSMVIGAPAEIFGERNYFWQLYEITGMGQGQTAVITQVANQPVDYNNISPIYGSDDSIIFTTDMPRTKNRFNYPQHDEYESSPTNTGLWKLSPATGEVSLLQHSPSGSFSPLIDSAGRLVFTRWDHLQRDQQASPNNIIEAFNYVNEPADASAPRVNNVLEVFPEPRAEEADLLAGTNLEGHRLNHFFPWEINQDGTEEETLNHVGRHELHSYFNRSMNDDDNLLEFIPGINRPNTNSILNTFMLHEDPNQNGRFVAIEAPEFATHNGGQIIAFNLAHGDRPDLITVENITHESTRDTDDSPPAEHIGFSRDPLTLTNGTLMASHTSETRANENEGTRENPLPRYDFKIKTFSANIAGDFVPDSTISNLGNVNISYFDPDFLVSYNGPLWELQPVEVVARTPPPMSGSDLPAPEAQVFAEENIDPTAFKGFLKANNLAVLVMRDVTTRDVLDTQQPYNLKVAGESHQTIGAPGQIYDISHMQFFQGDQIRGSGGVSSPDAGQRVIAQYLHDTNAMANNIPFVAAPAGSTEIYPDGSVAAFVPSQRAMAWQSLDPSGTPVVRERYWITFQPGEIRTCGGCHGVNDLDQSGALPSVIKAEAFRALLQHWQENFPDLIFADDFE
ncbi:hypothetical protein MNBD_GAMMA02-190 [hydrothermal vent metagenome]|uniref:Hydrazine synthase alpha subunit middle domain-containing protein n=1 Tax=hydrothermal vent metagenome TaxID=652676 RepID=A0A3B0VZR3_9ZZZZ